jgi:predicted DNA-binding transcriptional regulator AlpA
MGSSSQRENREPGNRSALPSVDQLLTPTQVAAITGLSTETLAQWRSQRRGPEYLKISHNCIRYQQSDLAIWLAARKVRVEVGTR